MLSSCERRSLDGDFASLARLGLLGNDDLKDTVLQAGLDVVGINGSRELEAAVEAAERTLADPEASTVATIIAGSHLFVLVIGLGHSLGSVVALVLDGWLVVLSFVVRIRDAWVLAALEGVLGVSRDGKGVVFGPFDVDLGLLDAGQLAVELVGVLGFADVEARGEGTSVGLGGGAELAGLDCSIKLVREAEQGREFVETWEEHRHFGWLGGKEAV